MSVGTTHMNPCVHGTTSMCCTPVLSIRFNTFPSYETTPHDWLWGWTTTRVLCDSMTTNPLLYPHTTILVYTSYTTNLWLVVCQPHDTQSVRSLDPEYVTCRSHSSFLLLFWVVSSTTFIYPVSVHIPVHKYIIGCCCRLRFPVCVRH